MPLQSCARMALQTIDHGCAVKRGTLLRTYGAGSLDYTCTAIIQASKKQAPIQTT